METVIVNAQALREVLEALNGPPHLIRELQVTRFIDNTNPIEVLIQNFNDAIQKENENGNQE